jgi:hypothetical protein
MPVEWEIFHTRLEQRWGTESAVQWVSGLFPGCKAVWAWHWHPSLSSTEVKERVKLYLYSPSGLLWPLIRRNLTLLFLLDMKLTFYSLAVSLRTTRFNIPKFYMVLTLCWVFCTDLRIDSDFCFIRYYLTGFYNRGGKCLQRGTDWFLI